MTNGEHIYASFGMKGDLLCEIDMVEGHSSATPVSDSDCLFLGNAFRNCGTSSLADGRIFLRTVDRLY